jgi:hypothetical protein
MRELVFGRDEEPIEVAKVQGVALLRRIDNDVIAAVGDMFLSGHSLVFVGYDDYKVSGLSSLVLLGAAGGILSALGRGVGGKFAWFSYDTRTRSESGTESLIECMRGSKFMHVIPEGHLARVFRDAEDLPELRPVENRVMPVINVIPRSFVVGADVSEHGFALHLAEDHPPVGGLWRKNRGTDVDFIKAMEVASVPIQPPA